MEVELLLHLSARIPQRYTKNDIPNTSIFES